MMTRRIYMLMLAVLMLPVTSFSQNLTVLHLNDTHSHIEPERSGPSKGLGGVIEQAAYVDSVRCADGKDNVLLLHAGDFSQGTSYFTEMGGDIEIAILNAMQFDAVCLGNHEFDNGFEELSRRLKDLEVPVVCANYDFAATPLEGLVKPYVIVQKAGMKIGIIGLLTDATAVVDKPIASMMKYHSPVAAAERYAMELKSSGCDIVICLTHLGFEDEPYTDVELASSVRNVDVIVGGHSHTLLDDLVKVKNPDGKDVIVVTDGKWGLAFGELKLKRR